MYSQVLSMLTRSRIPFDSVDAAGASVEARLECFQCAETGRTFQDKKLCVYRHSDRFICHRCQWKGSTATLAAYLAVHYGDMATTPQVSIPTYQELRKALDQNQWDLPPRMVQVESWLPRSAALAWPVQEAREYLLSRDITQSMAQEFGLLYASEGYYARRIIIPICDYQGEYKTFVARAIDQDAEKKYLFPKGSRTSSLLYNIHSLTRTAPTAVWLTEGVFDAMHCTPFGVATFGKHISEAQLRLLRLLRPQKVILLWDWDAWAKTPELWDQAAWRLQTYFKVIPVRLPRPHTDPTDYTRSELLDMIRHVRSESVWNSI